jgi:hypothetical protein
MRLLFALLALVGLSGVALGIFTMIRGAGQAPFRFENYGGPGPLIGGLLLIAVSLYLFLNWPRFEAGSRDERQR